MERGNMEVLLEEKLIELLKTSIAFDSRSNRNKTYSLLGEAVKERSIEQTNNLIELIDKQIRSFEADSIKNFFKENSTKYGLFKDEIDSFIDSLDKKISFTIEENKNEAEKKNVKKLKEFIDEDVRDTIDEVKKNISESEYNYFAFETPNDLENDYSKLTRDEIDGFMKKIDDKLAELEAEAEALENKNQ